MRRKPQLFCRPESVNAASQTLACHRGMIEQLASLRPRSTENRASRAGQTHAPAPSAGACLRNRLLGAVPSQEVDRGVTNCKLRSGAGHRRCRWRLACGTTGVLASCARHGSWGAGVSSPPSPEGEMLWPVEMLPSADPPPANCDPRGARACALAGSAPDAVVVWCAVWHMSLVVYVVCAVIVALASCALYPACRVGLPLVCRAIARSSRQAPRREAGTPLCPSFRSLRLLCARLVLDLFSVQGADLQTSRRCSQTSEGPIESWSAAVFAALCRRLSFPQSARSVTG